MGLFPLGKENIGWNVGHDIWEERFAVEDHERKKKHAIIIYAHNRIIFVCFYYNKIINYYKNNKRNYLVFN